MPATANQTNERLRWSAKSLEKRAAHLASRTQRTSKAQTQDHIADPRLTKAVIQEEFLEVCHYLIKHRLDADNQEPFGFKVCNKYDNRMSRLAMHPLAPTLIKSMHHNEEWGPTNH